MTSFFDLKYRFYSSSLKDHDFLKGIICDAWTLSGGGNGNPLQYSCLENPMDGGAWQATVCGVTQSQA